MKTAAAEAAKSAKAAADENTVVSTTLQNGIKEKEIKTKFTPK